MIVIIEESDMVKVSFEIQKEELSYYQDAFITVAQTCLRNELSASERNSLTLMLNVAQEMVPDPQQDLYHVYDLPK